MSKHSKASGSAQILNGIQNDAQYDSQVPSGNAAGFTKYFQNDILSGFLVFLIALPLCLGISLASGYPPMAGVFTAIVGSLVATFISNSEMTIKGPAAGLIVIALGCIEDFGGNGFIAGFSATDMAAYRSALAVGVAAAVFQILFAMFRAGILGEFFPISTVHGMLAAIGVIIITKQLPVVLGSTEKIEPLQVFDDLGKVIETANPAIAVIGVLSLLIMFLWPYARKRVRIFQYIPSPLVVALFAVPIGIYLDLLHAHTYTLGGHVYELSDSYLVAMPDRIFGMFEKITTPDFSSLTQFKAWKWAFLFFAVGTLESVLSTKAVDLIDPWQRKTNIDRDILGVGVANLGASLIGGLPMISEIVRSKANIDNGARTRYANFWHGIFLLVCVSLIPTVLHHLPLAALAAMLVYTGFRLAHPSEFLQVYRIGREQLVIFVATLVAVLATDLLVGVAIGIAVKLLIHLYNGVPLRSVFKLNFDVEPHGDETILIRPHDAAVFSNWIPFRRQIETIGLNQNKHVVLDVSEVKLIDHSVMDRLKELQRDFSRNQLELNVVGMDAHVQFSSHAQSARKQGRRRMKRVTIYADRQHEEKLREWTEAYGVQSFTAIHSSGASVDGMQNQAQIQVRIEFLISFQKCEALLRLLRAELGALPQTVICVESVEIFQMETAAEVLSPIHES